MKGFDVEESTLLHSSLNGVPLRLPRHRHFKYEREVTCAAAVAPVPKLFDKLDLALGSVPMRYDRTVVRAEDSFVGIGFFLAIPTETIGGRC